MTKSLEALNCLSANYVEGLLEDYLRDPESSPPEWREYFAELVNGHPPNGHIRPSFRRSSLFNPPAVARPAADALHLDVAALQDRVDQLIRAYRVRGHLIAKLDPLDFMRPERPELDPRTYRLTEQDLDRPFSTSTIGGPATQTLRGIVQRLRHTYCRFIGAQFMHIDELSVRDWLQQQMEETENRLKIGRDEQLRIFRRLTNAVIFEEFVRKKYVGAKTFSLEGAESLIPLLDLAIERAAEHGVREIVLGMAHRGRLNVLANILGKRPQEIFWEFEDADPEAHRGRGDVKYHLGFSSDWTTAAGHNVHLSLCFNPSHLEFVNPVAVGRMRAKQDRAGDRDRKRGMTLLIHGDAAFIGEGVVQETLNLSQLNAYKTGGTLHVVVNNQLGFTTSPSEGRSSTYATDVAKMLQIPIFHVNGEDPEAVAQVVKLALDFRHHFERDVVIDMYCYRRLGHNEGDEPSFTQPLMYRKIEQRESVRDSYLDRLLTLGEITVDEADQIAEEVYKSLEQEFEHARTSKVDRDPHTLGGVWKGYLGGPEPEQDDPDTGVAQDRLSEMLNQLAEMPADFHLHRKLERASERRRDMARGKQPLDWAAAEALALGTLAIEGHPIRLSGQDSERGTFSQRHAVLVDVEDGHRYVPLQHLTPDQAAVEIYNSPLSEAGVVGFEYGYSLDYPQAFVAWEAQFGDFWNAAQVIVDQFIVSAEDKWRRLSGIILLLPHGFEGQGPEHSSARLERFLMLAAEQNIQVIVPTSSAQYFHALRRQVVRHWRKPLVVLTPKSLLRHEQMASSLEELARGRFQRVIADQQPHHQGPLNRIILCSGKIYFDLVQARTKRERQDVAIVRVEQLYPLPLAELEAALQPYHDKTPLYWVQEEPANMGAWQYMRVHLGERVFGRFPLSGVSRPESASPATGSGTSHKQEQEAVIAEAFGEL